MSQPDQPPKKPILIPKLGKRAKKKDNYTPSPVPDEREDFDFLFERKYGKFIVKDKTIGPELPPVTPAFQVDYNPATDSSIIDKGLKFDDHVPTSVRTRIRQLIINYWCCFREQGLTIPIKGYEKVIDTGSAPPVNCKKIHYGIHESPIMQKTIDTLLSNDMIIEDNNSS